MQEMALSVSRMPVSCGSNRKVKSRKKEERDGHRATACSSTESARLCVHLSVRLSVCLGGGTL